MAAIRSRAGRQSRGVGYNHTLRALQTLSQPPIHNWNTDVPSTLLLPAWNAQHASAIMDGFWRRPSVGCSIVGTDSPLTHAEPSSLDYKSIHADSSNSDDGIPTLKIPSLNAQGSCQKTAGIAAAAQPELGSMADVPLLGFQVHNSEREQTKTQAQEQEQAPEQEQKLYTRYSYGAPIVYMKRYLRYLHERCLQNSVTFHRAHVRSLAEAVELVHCSWSDDSSGGGAAVVPAVVVNCAGLGAATLLDVLDDTMAPRRGVLVYLKAPEVQFVCSNEEDGAPNITYMVPQPGGIVACGGLSAPHSVPSGASFSSLTASSTTATLTFPVTAAEEAAVLRRCCRLVPALKGAPIVKRWAGLRPGRRDGVRLERSATDVHVELQAVLRLIASSALPATLDGSGGGGGDGGDGACKSSKSNIPPTSSISIPVVHCYGHGGSGVTLSWGCADDVAALVTAAAEEQGLRVHPARSRAAAAAAAAGEPSKL